MKSPISAALLHSMEDSSVLPENKSLMLHFVLSKHLENYYICELKQSEKHLCSLVKVSAPLKTLKT